MQITVVWYVSVAMAVRESAEPLRLPLLAHTCILVSNGSDDASRYGRAWRYRCRTRVAGLLCRWQAVGLHGSTSGSGRLSTRCLQAGCAGMYEKTWQPKRPSEAPGFCPLLRRREGIVSGRRVAGRDTGDQSVIPEVTSSRCRRLDFGRVSGEVTNRMNSESGVGVHPTSASESSSLRFVAGRSAGHCRLPCPANGRQSHPEVLT
jgi:hypothetical protein